MIMYKIALALACLSCAGHGWRLHTGRGHSQDTARHSSATGHRAPVVALNEDLSPLQKLMQNTKGEKKVQNPNMPPAPAETDASDAGGELQDMVKSADVVFFELEGCPFCRKAEEAMTAEGIEFKKVSIGPFKSALQQTTGKTSAPSVWIKGTYVGGCNDGTEAWHGVLPMLKSGKFTEMLKA
mmetsp:Transcript_123901/g.214475  ORF Transcript_123901/g.214475 Transcript_123901/m.214475 type:complete len:183 (+) Transcript_123901:66-614(+)